MVVQNIVPGAAVKPALRFGNKTLPNGIIVHVLQFLMAHFIAIDNLGMIFVLPNLVISLSVFVSNLIAAHFTNALDRWRHVSGDIIPNSRVPQGIPWWDRHGE